MGLERIFFFLGFGAGGAGQHVKARHAADSLLSPEVRAQLQREDAERHERRLRRLERRAPKR